MDFNILKLFPIKVKIFAFKLFLGNDALTSRLCLESRQMKLVFSAMKCVNSFDEYRSTVSIKGLKLKGTINETDGSPFGY